MVGREDRHWCAYNEQLVMRGEILLELKMAQSGGEMNQDKQGRPFVYPKCDDDALCHDAGSVSYSLPPT